MFKNFNEVITVIVFIAFALFILRTVLSYLFNINKESFSLKDQIKFFYDNEDE